ncbi:glycoside hydrolase family 13 protein [Phaeodactylibacter luteus]|uniref:Alpha-amlyase n=1 Tax=Phaeodactylibacter luteus TaxID=1564516 RepID=A0A5C6RGS1_9BACT|nr:glycoside hydrolase family 13 protein [Phaeodactylibacter luteus]TXB61313.1 alpha-amlyase [Phaeodactylibacter luteus]
MNKNITLTFLIALALPAFLRAQIDRIEPPHWWAGMNSPSLQLLVQGDGIGQAQPAVSHPGITIERVNQAHSPNYLFIDLRIAPTARAGTFDITFKKEGAAVATASYELKARERSGESFIGFSSKDVIQLITPDRFANGDPSNDSVAGLAEQGTDRNAPFARHGGDIQGIINSLDYLQEMGYTAIWPSPLLENDMPRWSYHGYAITDYYKVDPRFGTMQDYRRLADEARSRGIKIIFDGVVNHCGSGHWWMEDLPFDDWLNFQGSEEAVVTNHRRTVNQDPYAAAADRAVMTGGWFVPTMPDLNQRNPFLATYLIQNSIWWVETLGLGGIRQDTYPYPDKDFLTDWTCSIMQEYPNFNIVGEEWTTNPLLVAYWQEGKENPDGYASCLPSTMDFPMQEKLASALTGDDAQWEQGLMQLYTGLANDFVYANPHNLLIFGDNHDMDRLATQLKGDPQLVKMALAWLLTTRGIPQIYYGTEALLNNDGFPGDHGVIRADLPGGWEGDEVSVLSGKGLSKDQQEVQAFLRKLLNWRKGASAIHHGKTLHFAPVDGIYTYFRYDGSQTVMTVINKQPSPAVLGLSRFQEILPGRAQARDVITGEAVLLEGELQLPARSVLVLELD